MLPSTKEDPSKQDNDYFFCPVTKRMLLDPYLVCPSGRTYEKEALDQVLAADKLDPVTRVPITSYARNYALRDAIAAHLKEQPKNREQQFEPGSISRSMGRPHSHAQFFTSAQEGHRMHSEEVLRNADGFARTSHFILSNPAISLGIFLFLVINFIQYRQGEPFTIENLVLSFFLASFGGGAYVLLDKDVEIVPQPRAR